jgi:hypothetical protein
MMGRSEREEKIRTESVAVVVAFGVDHVEKISGLRIEKSGPQRSRRRRSARSVVRAERVVPERLGDPQPRTATRRATER